MSYVPRSQSPNPYIRELMRIFPLVGAAIFFSFFINMLMFASPLYMLQIYDRVVATRSQSTLLALTLIMGFLLLIYALLEFVRSRVLVRVGLTLDEAIADEAFVAVHRGHLRAPQGNFEFCLRDVDTIRDYISGSGLIALCDAPWFPLFVFACFVLHPWYGWIALGGSLVTLLLTLANERLTKHQLNQATGANMRASKSVQTSLRNAEVMQAMGMVSALRQQWLTHHSEVLGAQAVASDRSGLIMSFTKFFRMFLQSGVLGVGAYLVIQQEISPGSIIAGSIFVGRALQPIEQVVGTWKGLASALGAYRRVNELFGATSAESDRMDLPPPVGRLDVQNLVVTPPGAQRQPVLRGISFALSAGDALALIGPSASGKSSLARALVGVWPILNGSVRLDGNELSHWNPEKLGDHIGYLPQDIELFGGTVAQNIARFREADPKDIVAAAMLAGCHEMIQDFADGYNTQIGESGASLSGGQRQRLALARAVFGLPELIVLDEPNSNLDVAAEGALLNCIAQLKKSRKTVVVISHTKSIFAVMDKVLVLQEGVVAKFGPVENVLSLHRPAGPQAVASAGGVA